MEPKIRVLTILNRLDMGGVEKTLLSCIPFLNQGNVKMSILCVTGGVLDEEFTKLGVELIDFEGNNKPFFDAVFLKKILKKKKFDVVHSRSGHTSGRYAKVCSEANIPFIVSIHNERAMFRNNWQNNWFLKVLRSKYLSYHKDLTVKLSSKIIGHSKANLNYYTNDLSNLGTDSIFDVLYNGVDFSKFTNYPDLDPQKLAYLTNFRNGLETVLVHIGKFKEQKNHSYLLEVFKKLDPVKNKIGLILIGSGELKEKIESIVKEGGLIANVLFVGMEINIAPYLFSSDIFVFPSLYEGFGNVLIEAQYAKLPIWVSDIKPHYEATYEGYYKYMFNPLNVDDGVNKLNQLLKDYKSGELLGIDNEAFSFVENFSIENMGNNLLNLYIKIVEKNN